MLVRVLALAAGLAAGALNCALLAAGCKRLGRRRGGLWLLGGVLVSVTGLVLYALLSPALLPWFGCACAGSLILLAVPWAIHLRKK